MSTFYYQKINVSQALVAHTCNPSYSRGRDQEHHGSKPAQANSFRDCIQKKPTTKIVAHSLGPEFKPRYYQKKNCSSRELKEQI
jgi:hypothetical protein